MNAVVKNYLNTIKPLNQQIGKNLAEIIKDNLPLSKVKLYHASPVWFIDDNPIVGINESVSGLELMFWSGQSFTSPGLMPVGKFKAAKVVYKDLDEVDEVFVIKWLREAQVIKWDYKNIRQNRGQLNALDV